MDHTLGVDVCQALSDLAEQSPQTFWIVAQIAVNGRSGNYMLFSEMVCNRTSWSSHLSVLFSQNSI